MKLNLGDGGINGAGYVGVDAARGEYVYPLAFGDATADEIRASHILEHFSHRQIGDVLREWVRVLKPGGWLKVAVPNFEWIARQYLAGNTTLTQGYVMGGHVNGDDLHGAIFDEGALREALEGVGLVDVCSWSDELEDCAKLPVSLNLQGRKPTEADQRKKHNFAAAVKALARNTAAIMSMPRLAFTDNYFCAMQALPPLGIELRKVTGAFWGQCLERGIEQAMADGKRYVLTVDYDTVYTQDDVKALLALAVKYPQADALAPIQASRTKATALFTVRGENGKNIGALERDAFDADLLAATTAHFGLTLIKCEALADLPKPWFLGTPNPENGTWDEGRTDDDIYLWRLFECHGKQLFMANRIAVGHAELMIRWPDQNMSATYQHPADFWKSGKPDEVWE